ncbi:hypothetical protein IWW51_006219 [Coemansia sp. RSA 2702]|nr:hypothetical protein IWW52_006411 [Coemansia sp. RSA 2704]KAJ2312355.1 hypothetical protein IWW54_002135 [Coemansia sp. RSA 2705]KAJ2312696.1 hypothetical protein IWW51_006219 [Coemansia sp. RSA 2702]KAJ2708392.1 hypothetical protein H4R23_007037 [Coemansia sp. Cherry 401B]
MTTRRSTRLLAKAATPAAEVLARPGKVVKRSPKKPKLAKAVGTANSPLETAPASTAIVHATLADPGAMDAAIRHLKEADPELARIIDKTTEVCSMALPRDDAGDTSYVSLCKSIIFQQVAGSAARAILLRFLRQYGTLKRTSPLPEGAQLTPADFVFPSAQAIVDMNVEEMRSYGLSQRKAEYLQAVAEQFNNGTLSEEQLARMTDAEVSQALVAIRGIGQWTADMFLMFHLKRPNVLPTLDLAVRKAMCHHFKVPFGKKTPTHEQMVDMARAWEPYRSVATWYMWRLAGTITQK